MTEDQEFTHVAVKKPTKRKIAILAHVLDGTNINTLVEFWAEREWKQAKQAGLVTDAMLAPKSTKKAAVRA